MNENVNEWKTCSVCNKKFKNLGAHMRVHKVKEPVIEEELFNEDAVEQKKDIIRETETPKLTEVNRVKAIFNIEEEVVPEILLKDFLVENEMTYEQLTKLIEKGKDGTAINVKNELTRKQEKGEITADSLAGQDIIETTDHNTCEALVRDHGYIAESKRGNSGKKKWILRKIK